VDDVEMDIVPCYEVKSTKEMKSAVDRTPFHVKYITENLPADLSDHVRLLKQFCKANGVYGADAKAQGLSGYACEILVINYGEFIDVLKGIDKWVSGEIVDTEEHYDKGEHKSVRTKFKGEPLILIDPTDRNRNVTSAFSATNFFMLKKATKRFLQAPSKEFFLRKNAKPVSAEELNGYVSDRGTELLLIKFEPPKVVPDILWPQLRKFADRVQSILEETKYEFKVLRKDVYTNENELAVLLFELEFPKLPVVQKRVGPGVFDHDDSKRFIERYVSNGSLINGPFIEDGNWVVEIERKFLTARDKLIDSLKKDKDTLMEKGIPNHVAEQLVKGFRIFSDVPIIAKILDEDVGFGVFLRKYFAKESLV
jgi:tRNA nucleotidyltransferase (CCA-adding enzyme)